MTTTLVFAGWTMVGAVMSYGALYAFTPWGLVILVLCGAVALALRSVDAPTALAVAGLLAGVSAFGLVAVASAGTPVA